MWFCICWIGTCILSVLFATLKNILSWLVFNFPLLSINSSPSGKRKERGFLVTSCSHNNLGSGPVYISAVVCVSVLTKLTWDWVLYLPNCQYKKWIQFVLLQLQNCMEQCVPVRVIRGHKSANSYVGKVYTYDGLYKVTTRNIFLRFVSVLFILWTFFNVKMLYAS